MARSRRYLTGATSSKQKHGPLSLVYYSPQSNSPPACIGISINAAVRLYALNVDLDGYLLTCTYIMILLISIYRALKTFCPDQIKDMGMRVVEWQQAFIPVLMACTQCPISRVRELR